MLYALLNPTINALLKSPLHWIVSWRIMTVEYSGRKSGKHYATPVSYFRDGNTVYCFTNGKWSNNFREPRPVTLRIKRKEYGGTALAAPASTEENVAIMARYFEAVPADAKFYGVTYDRNRKPHLVTVRRAASYMTMIRIDLLP